MYEAKLIVIYCKTSIFTIFFNKEFYRPIVCQVPVSAINLIFFLRIQDSFSSINVLINMKLNAQ